MSPDLDHLNPVELGAEPPVVSDRELLCRYARDGDDGGFADLVHRHVDLVYSAALRQLAGDHQRAEDVTLLVFTELAQKASRLQSHPALSGWLYTTTRNMARTVARAEQRRIRREQMALTMQPEPDGPNLPVPEPSWARIAAVLDEVMHELSEDDRVAVVLRHFEDRPFAEVGHQLGMSPNAARMRAARALDKLRDRLARRGITSTTAALGAVLGVASASVRTADFSSVLDGGGEFPRGGPGMRDYVK